MIMSHLHARKVAQRVDRVQDSGASLIIRLPEEHEVQLTPVLGFNPAGWGP